MTDARDAAGLNAVLEALSFERRRPDARAFEELFLRFSRRVACEALTRPAGDPESFDAGHFFAEWVEEETGLAGGERGRGVMAGTGWRLSSSETSPRASHVTVTEPSATKVADSLPIPVGMSCAGGSSGRRTGSGNPASARMRRPSIVAISARCASSRLLISQGRKHVPSANEASKPTPRASHSNARASSSRAALEKLFALELEGVALPGESREALAAPATLSVFHESPVSAEEARGRIARDAPPLSLIVGREVLVEESGAGSRITIASALAPTLPAEGPTEAVRKTLVFHHVSELFELSRG